MITEIGKQSRFRITIIESDGNVITDSQKEAETMENHLYRPEVQASIYETYGDTIRYSNTVKSQLLYVSRLIDYEDKSSGFVRVSFWLKFIEDSMNRFSNDYLETVLYLSIISTLIAYILSLNLTNPIRNLAEFSKNLPKENFKSRIESNSQDEIGELTNSLNNMAENIETLFNQLRNEQESLLTIMNNMAEGLLVVNFKKTVVMANNKYQRNPE